MLNSLFDSGSGKEIYVVVSPSGGLEVIDVDNNGEIKSYAQAPLEYDDIRRQVADYEDFKQKVQQLFTSRNIPIARAHIHLCVPFVWLGYKSGIPLFVAEPQIDTLIVNELETSFVFQKDTPIPAWCDAVVNATNDSRNVFYTGLQSSVVESFNKVFSELGAQITRIECSLTSTLKGLYSTNIAREIMDRAGTPWSLILLTNVGYQLITIQDNQLVECYDEAIATEVLKSEDGYSTISNSLQIAFMGNPTASIVIVSNTDFVSAGHLATQLQLTGEVVTVENNQFRDHPLTEISLNVYAEDQVKVSLNALGVISKSGILPFDFVFSQGKATASAEDYIEIPIGNTVIKLTPQKAMIIALIFAAIVAGTTFGIRQYLQSCLDQETAKQAEIAQESKKVKEELDKYNAASANQDFDPVKEIETVLKNNRLKIMSYSAIGSAIPKNVYLTYYMTGGDGMINIRGCARSVEDVYVYFENLKDQLTASNLRLSKLDLKEGNLDELVLNSASPVDSSPYVFEITNMDDAQLKTFMDYIKGVEQKPEEADANKDGKASQGADANKDAAKANSGDKAPDTAKGTN